jgi:predicted nucleic acid-binding protein
VTRYLLDTNIISNVIKPNPSRSLTTWMAGQADSDLFISSLTVAEVQRGILEMSSGKKRNELERWFYGPAGPQALFAGRVLPFDERAAEANDCIIVTDNEKDFAGLMILNPMRR